MKIYEVGGSVRDRFLDEKAEDMDYVVVGATEKEFLSKYPGARKVGKSFPVFLYKGREYAFARKEIKTAPGHKGFEINADPGVSLEDDLFRRDLTVNAMARDPETGEIVDPFNGMDDLKKGVLRHVSRAFEEDPLRVYRICRFKARFPDFTVADETMKLMKKMKDELSDLSVERVWLETEKALGEKAPHEFFKAMKEVALLSVHFPEIKKLTEVPPGPEKFHKRENTFEHTMDVMENLPEKHPFLCFAALCHDLGKGLTPLSEHPHHPGHDKKGVKSVESLSMRLKIPKKFKIAGVLASKYHMLAKNIRELRPSTAIKMLKDLKLFPFKGVEGFFDLVEADSREKNMERFFMKQVISALDVKLPGKYRGKGKKSGEILMQLMVEKYKQLLSNYRN
ncbi:MAG: multifunctional CCA tRNA nucleotidyl transferase/2'3'-cyclic phosphodiesterase/2'nucleotidase/phosphatase [bacterium]